MSEEECTITDGESNVDSQNTIEEFRVSRKRKAHSIGKKLEAVAYSNKYSKRSAAKKFDVTQSRIQEWVKQEKELCNQKKGAKRVIGAGRHLTFAELDDELAKWVREQRAGKKKVSRRILKQEALKMFVAEAEEEKKFKASEGWVQKFMERHQFRVRFPTTVCQKPPVEYEKASVNFVMYMCQLREKINYDYIYACDETAVWLDPGGGKCIADKGSKEVSVLTTGHEKLRVTVMLAGRHDGYKCQPYVLLPRKRVDPTIVDKFKGKLQLAWKGTTWMNDDLTNDFLMRVMGESLFQKRLLVWDSFRCHISESTKN